MALISLGLSALIVISSFYVAIVRSVRHRNVTRTEEQYGSVPLTPLVAQKVIQALAQYDSPFIYTKALEFGLLRTYAIPSIARLLCATGALVRAESAGARVEDTDTLISEMLVWDLNSERCTLAIARMNYLHGKFGGSINNEDLKYTLAVFILQPGTWMARYEWRAMTQLEQRANLVFWNSIGERMGIRDLSTSYEECQAWSEAYEAEHMVYDKNNQKLGDATLQLFLHPVPAVLRPLARKAALAFTDARLRRAFGGSKAGYAEAPAWMQVTMTCVLWARATLLRNFFLPRATAFTKLRAQRTKDGFYRRIQWSFVPLYVEATWWNSLVSRYLGFGALGPHSRWHSHGYTLESVGPEKYREHGHEQVREAAAKMRACPFA